MSIKWHILFITRGASASKTTRPEPPMIAPGVNKRLRFAAEAEPPVPPSFLYASIFS